MSKLINLRASLGDRLCRGLLGVRILLIVIVILVVLGQEHAIVLVALLATPATASQIQSRRSATAAGARGGGRRRSSTWGGSTALAEIGSSPLGSSVLEPRLHLPVGQLQLEGQVAPLLGGQVFVAGEAPLKVFGLLGCESDLAAFALHSEVGHVEAGRRIGVAIEGRGSSSGIGKAWG